MVILKRHPAFVTLIDFADFILEGASKVFSELRE